MKLALIGYGNMGQEIEKIAVERSDYQIISISTGRSGLDREGIANADVAIEFTTPDASLNNIREVIKIGTPLVVGTTGWYEHMKDVEKLVNKVNTGLIYGQNFSIGANIFFNVVAYAATLVNTFEGYDVYGVETHHTGKKDSPSGTARKLSEIIINNYPVKKTLQTDKLERRIKSDELHFASIRAGRNFGRHEIAFDSEADEIRLTHQAWSRRGFAEGALCAAEFIKSKKGLYNFSDIFGQLKK